MPNQKEHSEFHAVALDGDGWHTPPGYPAGILQKILSGDLDEIKKIGNRTRLLRFLPGAFTTSRFVHDYWEEVYLVAGDLIVGDNNGGGQIEIFGPNTYACRPPGIFHGPFSSKSGCLLLEFHYFD